MKVNDFHEGWFFPHITAHEEKLKGCFPFKRCSLHIVEFKKVHTFLWFRESMIINRRLEFGTIYQLKLKIPGKRIYWLNLREIVSLKAAIKVVSFLYILLVKLKRNSREDLETFVWKFKSVILRFTPNLSSTLIVQTWVSFPCNSKCCRCAQIITLANYWASSVKLFPT